MHEFHPADLTWHATHDLAAVKGIWSELEQVAVATPFQRHAWVCAWYEAFGRHDGSQIRIVTAFAGDKPVALFPLAIERKLAVRCLTWAAHRWNDYNAPLILPEFLASISTSEVKLIWRNVVDCVGGVDVCLFDKQPSSLADRANAFAGFSAIPEACSAHAVRLDCDWPAFASRHFGRRLSEKERGLARRGALALRRITAPDDTATAIDTLLEWKSAQLTMRGGRNPFDDARAWAFLNRAARDESGLVQVYALELDGRPLALALALACARGLLVYQTAYDAGPHAHCSPGQVLFKRLIEMMIRERQTLLDFSLGDEAYKRKLCDLHVELHRTIHACSIAGIVPAALLRQRLVVKRWIKAHPWVFAKVQSAHKQIRPMCARLIPGGSRVASPRAKAPALMQPDSA